VRRVLIISSVILGAVAADAAVNTNPKARIAAAATVVRGVQAAIPADYWYMARCVVAFPELKNTEFFVGGKDGKGVMSCRTGERWTAPVFMRMERGSRMAQVGAQQIDIVLLIMNEGAVETLQRQKVTLGAEASIAPGPIDSQAHVDLTTLRADILTYSRAKGLYLNLAGGVLKPDEDSNREVYGKGASLGSILASRDLSASAAQGFIAAVSSQPADPVATPRRNTPLLASVPRLPMAVARTADDDVRARILDMQLTIDRLLTVSPPAPVGTSGTYASPPEEGVTVDRARLLQLRQQLDAMLAVLNRP
jgi:lipid-binding SYLF domain-containing protein